MNAQNIISTNIIDVLNKRHSSIQMKDEENFVVFFVKLLQLWEVQHNNEVKLETIVEDVLLRLNQETSLENLTIKMQYYFLNATKNLHTIESENQKKLLLRLSKLKENIFQINTVRNKFQIEETYKKFAYYITTLSGLGDVSKENVFNETLAALKSIVSEEELKMFIHTHKDIKEEQLQQFTKIVSGIRLFNKDCNKGGEDIEDLPSLLDKSLNVMKSELQNSLISLMAKVNTLTTILDKNYVLHEINGDYKIKLKTTAIKDDIDTFKTMLILYRQHELFTRRTLEYLNEIREKSNDIFYEMQKGLKKTHDSLYMRLAVPATVVFPLFEKLSNAWRGLQNQIWILSEIIDMVRHLHRLDQQIPYENYKTTFERVLGKAGCLTDAQRLEATAKCVLSSGNQDVSILTLENFKDIDSIDLEYLGFCCWKLVETNGALIPGNPSMGVARYRNKNYVFSTPEACISFAKNPEMYLERVLQLARSKPQLVHFLQLEESIKMLGNEEMRKKKDDGIVFTENKEIQCENHVVEGFIDVNYRWNVWDLKRDALKMMSILKCKTVGMQTGETRNKHSVSTQ